MESIRINSITYGETIMAITRRANSKNYYSEFVIGGKKFIKSTKTTNRALASKIDLQYYNDAVEQSKLGGKRISLKDAMDQYKESIRGNEKRKTQIGYLIKWVNANMDTSLPMSKVDTAFLHQFVTKRFALGMKPGTVQHDVLMLSGTIKLMKNLGYEVCTVEMPKIKVKNGRDRILSPDEEIKLLQELLPKHKVQGNTPERIRSQQRLYVLTTMLLDTGCRWSEIAGVKWSNLDFENKTIHVWREKTSTAAVLAMSNRVHDLLQEMEQTCDWVFPNKTNDGPRVYNEGPFKRACERAGLEDFSFHSLRHTRITRLTQAGLSLSQIKAVSGHADLKSLQRYQHLTSNDVVDMVRDILNS
jgi:integrase